MDLEFEAPTRFLKSLCGQIKAVSHIKPPQTCCTLHILSTMSICQHHLRFERTCVRRSLSNCSQRFKTIQAGSFTCAGPRLFNCLPREIRDLTGITTEAFKRRLDKFLENIPDEPPVPHGPTSRGAASNSIIDQLQYVRFGQRCGSDGPPGWPWW